MFLPGVTIAKAYGLYKLASSSGFSISTMLSEDPVLLARLLGLTFAPAVLTWTWWNGLYHGFGAERGVDTSKFMKFKVPSLAKYYKNRRIPMCELYELYVEDKFDWNEECEGGDCFKILHLHRCMSACACVRALQILLSASLSMQQSCRESAANCVFVLSCLFILYASRSAA